VSPSWTAPGPVLRLVAAADLPAPTDPAWAALLTADELAYCRGLARVADHLAARAAAKRAVADLLGLADGAWHGHDIEVRRVPGAPPRLALSGAAAGAAAVGVSLSHAAGHAAALAWPVAP
jgi:phosphopantetheinyl transferase (holo-ACP synthase)